MTRSSKPAPAARPKLGTLPQRVGLADLSVAGSVVARTDASWRGSTQTSAQRGYGYKWQQARAAFLLEHPLCDMCERAGRVVAANVVDHREPHRGDQTLFWRRSNWQSLCTSCHSGEKQRQEASDGR